MGEEMMVGSTSRTHLKPEAARKFGNVPGYLVRKYSSFLLSDTSLSSSRREIRSEMEMGIQVWKRVSYPHLA